jgi:nuclear transport factor 2 (NTF2) superfamily protein
MLLAASMVPHRWSQEGCPCHGWSAVAAPFTLETVVCEVGMAEDAWNTRDPAHLLLAYTALAYTEDSRWRNRAESIE